MNLNVIGNLCITIITCATLLYAVHVHQKIAEFEATLSHEISTIAEIYCMGISIVEDDLPPILADDKKVRENIKLLKGEICE